MVGAEAVGDEAMKWELARKMLLQCLFFLPENLGWIETCIL
jgi:hypothetical protein